ncbi:hypothetical protein Zm00014a_043372, partial [Zea mays]
FLLNLYPKQTRGVVLIDLDTFPNKPIFFHIQIICYFKQDLFYLF